MDHSKLVVVQSHGSRPEADLAKGELEDAGIQALIQADTAGGMTRALQRTSPMTINLDNHGADLPRKLSPPTSNKAV
jgi:hypothetical protein